MCIALYVPKDCSISKREFDTLRQSNPDGFGMLFFKEGKLAYRKFISRIDDLYVDYIHCLNNKPMVLHFRTASTSSITLDDCHPHFVNGGLAFVHNGNFPEFMSDKQSDTKEFNERILQKLPYDFLQRKEIVKALELYCKESFSKLIFMDDQERVTILNENAGMWKEGVFYTNGGIKNYIGYGFSGVYYYTQKDIRHKGGLQTVEMLSNKESWKECLSCNGYYKNLKTSLCSRCNTLKRVVRYVKTCNEL